MKKLLLINPVGRKSGYLMSRYSTFSPLGLAYVASILLIYSQTSGIARAYMVTLIPLVEFVLVIFVSLIVVGIMCRLSSA